MTFVKCNKDTILSIYSMQQFLFHTALFQNVFYQVHLIFVDGSSHPEVFYKICALEILNFTRTIQYFVLRSLEFVFERFLGGRTGLWSAYWIFVVFLCFPRTLGTFYFWKSCHGCFVIGFFCDTLSVWVLTCSNT